jgi:hypothetical protein
MEHTAIVRRGRAMRMAAIGLACSASIIGCAHVGESATGRRHPTSRPRNEERLSFQAQDPWRPRVNLNADVAMAYDIDPTLPARLQSWKDRGYIPHVMTGVAWGEYQDYMFGRWDGKNHMDEAQMEKNGHQIGHGKDVWYMSPSETYGQFLCVGVKRALDAGAQAIHLEEPEFWVRAGWEEAFKREWQAYYNEPWIAPDSSPDAQYRASKLKYFLYRRALSQVFAFVREYGKEHGRTIKCYVPTHSMINYANWGIVSPQSSLMEVGCDGFIAQVWTGTARTPNFYEGIEKERTFETAFLEYGSMQNLARATGSRMWYLNDPIEDNANHSWFDYKMNWESTLVASLLQPEVWHYEIMPWPHRIFEKNYPSTQPVTKETPRIPIPKEYETELQAVITAMGDMKQPAAQVKWLAAGTPGTGVLVSDTMMFQRFGPDSSDGRLGNFYGLSLPLLMRGVPVEPVQIETAQLSRYKVLLLTYEGQKPPKPEFHAALAAWVKAGGALVVVDDDRDPFHSVREWWNTGDKKYATPRQHLYEVLGVPADAEGETRVGKGCVVTTHKSPARLSRTSDGAEIVRGLVRGAMKTVGVEWKESKALVLRRGPYIVAAGLEGATTELPGRYLSLFDKDVPTVKNYQLAPGSRALLIDLDSSPEAVVIAAACRVRDEEVTAQSIKFGADGIADSNAVVCIQLPKAPKSVKADGVAMDSAAFAFEDGILRIRFPNRVDPVRIEIER